MKQRSSKEREVQSPGSKVQSREYEASHEKVNCFNFRDGFRVCAHWLSMAVGSPTAFLLALGTVLIWALLGPVFDYSDTWQLVINTSTTIVTFLMVFLIQNTQNRDTKALHLKLDELLRGVKGARTSLINLENLSDEELDDIQKQFDRLRDVDRHPQGGKRA